MLKSMIAAVALSLACAAPVWAQVADLPPPGAGRAAYAAATTEAERRRMRRQQEIRRRQLEDSFTRMSRGAGPWVVRLPGGTFTGPDPWQTMTAQPRSSTSAGGSWSRDIAQVGW
jgi:hypothetical protein